MSSEAARISFTPYKAARDAFLQATPEKVTAVARDMLNSSRGIELDTQHNGISDADEFTQHNTSVDHVISVRNRIMNDECVDIQYNGAMDSGFDIQHSD